MCVRDTLFDEDQDGDAKVGRQEESTRLNPVSNKIDTGTPELLVIGVPDLSVTSFRFNNVVGLERLDVLKLAQVLFLLRLLVVCAEKNGGGSGKEKRES